MKPRIIVVGSSNTDMVVNVHHIPQAGETILGDDYNQFQGGKGANQAVAAARLGADVVFIAKLGQDALGDASINAYKVDGINTEFIIRDAKASSGVALIMVNRSGENIIAVASGANSNLSPVEILGAEKAIQGAKCLLVQLEIPLETVQAAIQIAAKHHVPIILNPAPAIQLPISLLEMVDFLTPNENEAVLLVGGNSTKDASAASQLLRSKFKVKNIVITLGEKGAQIVGTNNETVPAYPVKSVDTTGAGDAFNGALAVALARGASLVDAVKFANAVAALSTTHPGAQLSMPTMKTVEAFLKENQLQEVI
jgi:ribokinase